MTLLLVGCLTLESGSAIHAADGSADEVLFYDPDANHQAIIQISGWINKFLARSELELRFRPIQRDTVFEATLTKGTAKYALISSEYLSRGGASTMAPILVPVSKGDAYYRKVLLDRGGEETPEYANKTIAATLTAGSEREASKRLLDSLARSGIATQGARILRVSKDIDGLLALAFGRVDAAVVTKASVATLEHLNANVAASLRLVAETAQILRSPLCAHEDVEPQQREAVVRTFESMDADPDGKNAMVALGFDAWVPFLPSMLETTASPERARAP